MSAFQPKNNLDLLFGGIQGLSQAPGIYRQDQQAQADRAQARQPVDANAVARKYAQMMESGAVSPKQAAYLAQQELRGESAALSPQSLQPPQQQTPLPGQQPSQVQGLRGANPPPHSIGEGLRAPSLDAGDLALQRPPVSFSPAETRALNDYGIPEAYRARETARSAEARLLAAEQGRTERLATTEQGRSTRQEDKQTFTAEENEKDRKLQWATAVKRAETAMRGIDARVANFKSRVAQNPKRRELVTRIGQKQSTLRTFVNKIIQSPEDLRMMETLKKEIEEMEDLLSKEEDLITTESSGPSPVGAPQASAPRSAAPRPAPQPAGNDERAKAQQWLQANPNHPKAAAVRAKLGL